MCFCSNNEYPYCDTCQEVYEAAKISDMDNREFQKMIRMVANKPEIEDKDFIRNQPFWIGLMFGGLIVYWSRLFF